MNKITASYEFANAFENYIRLEEVPKMVENLSDGSYAPDFYQFPDDVRKDFRKSLAEHKSL